jgi:hypothetical protein
VWNGYFPWKYGTILVGYSLGYVENILLHDVGTGADLGFNAQERTNKTLTTGPFSNTCEAYEVSP